MLLVILYLLFMDLFFCKLKEGVLCIYVHICLIDLSVRLLIKERKGTFLLGVQESRNVAFSGGSSSATFNDPDEKPAECRLKRVNTPHYGKGYRIGSGANSARSQQLSSTHNDNQQPASSPPPTTSANVTVFSSQHGCSPANPSTAHHNSFNSSYGRYQQQQYSRQPYYSLQQQHPSNNPPPHTGYFQSLNGGGGSSGGSSTHQHPVTTPQAQPHYTDGMLEVELSVVGLLLNVRVVIL